MQFVAKEDGLKVPIKSWITKDIFYSSSALHEQTCNIAKMNHAFHHVALMPDAHAGYGMPIGGVLALKGAVCPSAVGYDIGCGVLAARTNVSASAFRSKMNGIVDQILEVIPVGLGMVQSNSALDHIKNDFLTYMEKDPPIDGFGTLGSGNHFISFDFDGDDALWIVIHSGSRSFGYAVASYYIEKAQLYNKIWHSETPSSELAFIPKEDGLYLKYVHDMNVALSFAEENRNNMLENIMSILSKNRTSIEIDVFLDSHHNFAAMENHFGSNVMVHRKGAIRARLDEKVVIPGNMNQGTVICIGSGNEESFTSCSHGAGRKLGRKEARRVLDLAEEMKELDKRNITLFSKNDAHDEMSGAYKDFDDVMRLQEDLVTVVKRLNTIGVIKG